MLIVLFLAGLIAGFINVMAGGGSALTLPILIFLGLDGSVANGTNRLAILIQNVFAVYGFKQNRLTAFRKSFGYAAVTLPGALAGAFIATKLDNFWFNKILAVVIIFIVFSMVLPKPGKKSEGTDYKPKSQLFLYLSLFGVGFYGGFIQAGVGFLLMATLFYLAGLDLIKVNMHKVFIVLIYTIPAFLVFAFSGNVDWLLGMVLAAGNGLGGWIGAHVSVKKGEKAIRLILIVMLIGMAVKLFIF